MKTYFNKYKSVWYHEGDKLLWRLANGRIFYGIPTAEQLLSWNFEERPPHVPTPTELLERAKASKIAELEAYDASDAVNSFTIGGVPMWLTVEERQQIATQISANEAVGRTTMTRWFGGNSFTFPISVWKQMLVALEVYAGDAINVTESHKAAINALTSVAGVEAYDFTTGYPTKLVFGSNE